MKNSILIMALGIMVYHAQAQSKFDVPFSKYKLKDQRCQGILHKSGSRINIPEGAFLHTDGSACKHEITLEYRELVSPIDILVSNTSMSFHDKGKRHFLESGGMFEIKGYCPHQQLKIAPMKQIQVQFAQNQAVSDMEAFKYDRTKNTWKKIKNPIGNLGTATKKDDSNLWGEPAPPPFNNFSNFENDGWEENCDGCNFDFMEYQRKETQAFNSMGVSEFGFYNYDKLINDSNSVQMIADFKIKNIPSSLTSVYVAYEGVNSLISFSQYDWEHNFFLFPNMNYKIFTIASDGRVAVFSESAKSNLDIKAMKGKKYTFELEMQLQLPENKDQLATLTGLSK